MLFFCILLCIWNFQRSNAVNNQQDATTFSFINLFKSALHVSGDNSPILSHKHTVPVCTVTHTYCTSDARSHKHTVLVMHGHTNIKFFIPVFRFPLVLCWKHEKYKKLLLAITLFKTSSCLLLTFKIQNKLYEIIVNFVRFLDRQ